MTEPEFPAGEHDAAETRAATTVPPVPVPKVLTSATREITKATLVQLTVRPAQSGQAMLKHSFVRQLGLRPGEVDSVASRLADAGTAADSTASVVSDDVIDLIRAFEQAASPSIQPGPSELVDLAWEALRTFGQEVVNLRAQALDHFPPDDSPTTSARGLAQHSLRNAIIAVRSLEANAESPLGMLNLERLEMAPAGLQRGELVATIPLAPLEETAVSHKEWSVLSKEFTSIVTDSLENTSETGVTDNTELSQSTSSQAQHSNQFNITGTVSGGISVISGSASTGFTTQDSTSQSATDSVKHATELTKKASSRAKQEHKVTISTTTVTGSSESSTRTLKNPSATQPMRIDYFSLMRKWRVRLYRYGLRLTYDLVIPEPGAGLRKAYKQLADYQDQVGPFLFSLPHTQIVADILPGESQPHYRVLGEKYGATVPDPPGLPADVQLSASAPSFDDAQIFTADPLEIPDGYRIKSLNLWFTSTSKTGDQYKYALAVLGSRYSLPPEPYGAHGPIDLTSSENGKFMLHATGKVVVSFLLSFNRNTTIKLVAGIEEIPTQLDPDPAKPPLSTVIKERWQSTVWNILRDAAQAQYYQVQQDIAARIAALDAKIGNVDTLTLRREESDEIMKGVVRFLLGPEFAFMPPEVVAAFEAAGVDAVHGIGFDGNEIGLDPGSWATVREHEGVIRFINQAIEWENVVTFLYSYFWDTPLSWDFIRQLQHPDSSRQAFLRAGSARVVLTVRKGWEEAWVSFAEGGYRTPPVTPDPRYLSIAQEIAAYDDRNYPGIPPANPGRSAVRLEDAVYTTSTATLATSTVPVSIKVASSDGFLVGGQVVIDSVDKINPADRKTVQETQSVTAIPDSTHIVVSMVTRPHDGVSGPYAVLQPGIKGALIAEWYEYTPSSGTDIEIGSDLDDTN